MRIAGAVLIGSGLALAGAAFQAVFRNPMVSPDVLGASGGAGMGASLALLVGLGSIGIQVFSFVGGWPRCSSRWPSNARSTLAAAPS